MDALTTPGTGLALAAHRHPLTDALLTRHVRTLQALSGGLGSPLHVLLPQVFAENLRQFKALFADYGIDARVLFAKKANKAACLVHSCAEQGIGVDVASCEELAKALAGGIKGEQIGVTGPQKTAGLLTLALRQHCLIAIDSPDELRHLVALASQWRLPARILLRLRIDSQPHSRFGLNEQQCQAALALCLTHIDVIDLHGFAFHLSGYCIAERALAASALIDRCLHARTLGLHNCRQVNIGGGLPVQYVAPEQWQRFVAQDAPAHYQAGKTFSGFYPYGVSRAGADALRDLLDHPLDAGLSLARRLREHGIGLIVEPGRALLDQAGFSLFTVQGVKHRQFPEGAVVTVQGSSLSLSEQWLNSEFLPDPVLLGNETGSPLFYASVGAATCLESDMLTWRRIGFARQLRVGDRLVYLNTAGYQMDSNESSFHEAAIPEKVVIRLADDELHWQLDRLDTDFPHDH